MLGEKFIKSAISASRTAGLTQKTFLTLLSIIAIGSFSCRDLGADPDYEPDYATIQNSSSREVRFTIGAERTISIGDDFYNVTLLSIEGYRTPPRAELLIEYLNFPSVRQKYYEEGGIVQFITNKKSHYGILGKVGYQHVDVEVPIE